MYSYILQKHFTLFKKYIKMLADLARKGFSIFSMSFGTICQPFFFLLAGSLQKKWFKILVSSARLTNFIRPITESIAIFCVGQTQNCIRNPKVKKRKLLETLFSISLRSSQTQNSLL